MPHVVFINRVYPPAGGATGTMLAEMAGALVEDGWLPDSCKPARTIGTFHQR